MPNSKDVVVTGVSTGIGPARMLDAVIAKQLGFVKP